MEHFIMQCKTSGYTRHETREGVVSGLKGWKRKCWRRERDGIELYRSARSTLGNRVKKKLTEKSSWYKNKRKREEEDVDSNEKEHSPRKRKRAEEGSGNRSRSTEATGAATENMSAIAVIMVPYTKGAELAKRIRNYEMVAKEQTGWYLKVVEKAGDSLIDLLHRSNPWSGQDCQRHLCLHCQTKTKTGKNITQDCTKEIASTRPGA